MERPKNQSKRDLEKFQAFAKLYVQKSKWCGDAATCTIIVPCKHFACEFFFSPLFNGFSTKRKKKIGIISGDSCTNNFLHFNNLQKPRRRRLLHNIENGKWPEARFFKVPEMFWARKAIFNGLYLKTERCIRLKPLVWREPLLILRIC